MAEISARKRIWGWWFFDWASQPYNTLMLTFIFGPWFAKVASAQLVASGLTETAARAEAQAMWGYGLTVTGLTIAILAPILGAIADSSGHRRPWIWLFSAMYVTGAFGTWWSAPEEFSAIRVLVLFGIGFIGMEFATIFTNSYLPTLGPKRELGRISGSGWAFGYLGGVVALAIMLAFFQAGADGRTMAGLSPAFGLDPATGADTRAVGPFTAIWYAVFMIPFFLWVRDGETRGIGGAHVGQALRDLWGTIAELPRHPSLAAYLGSSMFYRDALNGMYTFGGIYAAGVLNWSIMQIGIFGIIAAISGALFTWIGGYADRAFGPKPVIAVNCFILMATAVLIVGLSPQSVFGIPLAEGSALPDILFYVAGILIGAAGGTLQSASRNMLTRQGNPERMTEAFGLYALSGKATTFVAPALIAVATDMTGNQRWGVTPLIGLFALGLVLLLWVRPEGDHK
ncbi:MFS transporter [Jhaorihella thermophila]|uniref:MFS transporter, UMF1 family n=1 Tax=Jhaorihella thermophila TaxID=488547 RepID=A0A1H5V070_9RHOB|nr:MFS transporter [Jhaorihella thermophila]SEF80580.1 MFS transporter, UMF1 family [Jhaorihella thermophila]